MNAAIRATVRQGRDLGLETVGISFGYKGLLEGNFQNYQIEDVGGIIERGGTVLQSKRAPEFRKRDVRAQAIRNLNKQDIEGLIVIGGDGTLNGAKALHEEGIPVIGIPASIDNDIYGTDISIGVDTALNMVVNALDRIRDTASALERAFLIEVMGRESGYIALMGGLAGGAEVILLPEVEYNLEEITDRLYKGYKRGKQHSIIVVAEGIYRKGSAAHHVADQIREEIGFEVRVTVLGHMQRGGSPSAFDRTLASRLGAEAVRRLNQGESGKMVGIRGYSIEAMDLDKVTKREKKLDMDVYRLAQVISK